MKNQSAFQTDICKIEIRDVEMPEIGADDVLVKIEYVGVCGSDLKFYTDPTFGGIFVPQLPTVLGHECAGSVAGLGENVTGLKLGDNVALEPGVNCGKCEFCLGGRYNLCPDVDFMACPPSKSAALTKYIRWPARMSHKLPDNVDTLSGAMIEPLGIGMMAAKRAGVGPGHTVAILGGGTIGYMCMVACLAKGAKKIIVADLYDNRLEFIKGYKSSGAEIIAVNSQRENTVEAIRGLTGGGGVDFGFETAGSAVTCGLTPRVVKRGGIVVQVGNVHGPVETFDFMVMMNNELNLVTSFRSADVYPETIKYVADGKAQVSNIINKVFPFEETNDAFMFALKNKNEAMKVAIKLA